MFQFLSTPSVSRRVGTTAAMLGVFSLVLFALIGCPKPAAPPTTATKGSFTVKVTTVGPATWNYTVSTTGSRNVDYVEFVLPLNVNNVTVAMPTGWTKSTAGGSIVCTTTTGGMSNNFSLTIDAANGPISLTLSDDAGATKTVVGTVAGPT